MKTASDNVAKKGGYSPPHPPQGQPLLSRSQAAAYLGISPQTLAADVCTQRLCVPMVKIGRRSMYRLTDLEAYCATNLHSASIKEAQK